MKFIKLEILHLASLDSDKGEVINFEEGALGESTIFSIVGPTGSGKSTILDAICLALYNCAPRYPRKKSESGKIAVFGGRDAEEDSRPSPTDGRNILSRGKNQGYSKLTFLANNGNLYRAEWSVSKKVKRYAPAATALYKITPEDGDIPDEWSKLPEIIGLDYEQFLRTVLIAQGSFASFLTASDDERYTLLEKLVGCGELYSSIAEKITQAKTDAENEYKRISSVLDDKKDDVISDEGLVALKDKIASLTDLENKARAELSAVEKDLGWYEAEDKYVKDIDDFGNALESAKENEAKMLPEKERLTLHDDTQDAVTLYREARTLQRRADELLESVKTLEENANDKIEQIKAGETLLASLKDAAEKAAAALKEQKPHIDRAREIKARLQEASKNAEEKSTAQKNAENALKAAKETLSKNVEDIRKADEALEKAQNEKDSLAKETKENLKVLAEKADEAARKWAEENAKLKGSDSAALQNAKEEALKRQKALNDALRIRRELGEKIKQKKDKATRQTELISRNIVIDSLLAAIDLKKFQGDLDTLKASYALMTSENWEQHRRALKDGEPCPLCGSREHVYRCPADVQPVVDDLKRLVEEQQSLFDSKNAEAQKLQNEKSQNEGELKSLEKELAPLSGEIQTREKEWSDLQSNYPDCPEDTEAIATLLPGADEAVNKFGEALDAYNALVKRELELRGAKENAEKAQQEAEKAFATKKDAAERKHSEASSLLEAEKAKTANLTEQEREKMAALEAAKKNLQTARDEILLKKNALKEEVGENDPEALEQQLTREKENSEKSFSEKKEAISAMRNELSDLNGRIDATKKTAAEDKENQAEKEESLEGWIASYNDAHEKKLSAGDIAGLSVSSENWEDIRTRLKEAENATHAAFITLSNAQRDHSEHRKNCPEKDRESLRGRKAELESRSNEELIDAQTTLKRHEDALVQMGNMAETLKEASQLKDEWEEIYKAIGGSKEGKDLRKIAQSYTLRFLVEHANAEIRKFNSRYELQQVKNSLGLRVIDHDRADDIRDTTSLSGGETFIVSLGLALGLSSLSSKNISFGNLFIDEGFGTLDPDTLATVIDSLSMLQSSQGKKVGVISHTDTMSERITTQIRIIKNGHSGSSHIEVYP